MQLTETRASIQFYILHNESSDKGIKMNDGLSQTIWADLALS